MARRKNNSIRTHRAPRTWWSKFSRDELLDLRICDLELKIEGTWLEECIQAIYEELAKRSLLIQPTFWLSDEFFSPSDVPGVAIPFYLAHPRLMQLERHEMLEVEGGTPESCMKILRHETGHVLQHSFQLQRRRKWQKLFGRSSDEYPDYYRPRPQSKRYVQHLDAWYAQSHPDEDFAETFAVWFHPQPRWKKRYQDWPALKKLEYVDELMEEFAGQAPMLKRRAPVDPVKRLRKTLREHYSQKKARYGSTFPDMFDRDLKLLFSADPKHKKSQTAAAFLRRNRAEIRQLVSRWSGEYEFTLDQVLRDMIGRCTELKLRAVGSERQLRLDFAILLTVQAMHYLYNDRTWHPL